ncbi:MAG: tetratricopeptide repeat protein [Acidobacteriota bacterium]
MAGENPSAFLPDVATTLNNLGNVLRKLGEKAESRQAFEEALPIYRQLAEQHPAAFLPDVAMTLNNLGAVLRDLGEKAESRQAHEEALEIYLPLAENLPAAFSGNLNIALRNYVEVAPKDEGDRWWRLWKGLQESKMVGGDNRRGRREKTQRGTEKRG